MRKLSQDNLKLDTGVGYLYVYAPEHEYANKAGKVYWHRYLASIDKGYWLSTEEHVHHIDENKLNNSIDNLRVCTASEHAKLHHEGNYTLVTKACLTCHKEFVSKDYTLQKFCSVHCVPKVKKFEVTRAELETLIWTYPFTTCGTMLGVSDNAVRKRAKSMGCTMPPARFHNKKDKEIIRKNILGW